MTKINRDRILNVLDRIQKAKYKATHYSGQVVQNMALLGLKTVTGTATERDAQQVSLELDYLEVPKTPKEVRATMNDFFHQVRRWCDRQDIVYAIQRKHGVSGLTDSFTRFGNTVIPHPWVHDQLALIEADLDVLRQYKSILVEAWFDYAMLNRLSLYRDQGKTWEPVDFSYIQAAIAFYDWAKVWERISYTSPSKLKQQGYDEVRSKPTLPDDKKHWEVHLWLGKGLYVDDPEESQWFCASNTRPYR